MSLRKFEHNELPLNNTPRNIAPLDFVDVDPNYHILKECFPEFPGGQIFDALEYGEGDLNKASEYLISGMGSKGSDDGDDEEEEEEEVDVDSQDYKILSLAEMFPDYKVEDITNALKESNYDFEQASDLLLNQGFIHQIQNELKIQDELTSKVESSNRTWASINDEISEIMSLTEMTDTNEVKSYYHQNGRKMAETLIDIIYNQRDKEEKERQQKERSKLKQRSLPRGGRVQTNNKNTGNNNFNAYTSLENNKTKTTIDEKPYILDENSTELAELSSLINEDPRLLNISWEFNEKVLIHFKGSVQKSMNLILKIIENPENVSKTFRDEESLKLLQQQQQQQSNFHTATTNSLLQESKFKPVLNKPKYQTSYKYTKLDNDLDKFQYKLRRDQLNNCKKDNRLDLHRFHVGNAKATTMIALDEWWEDELRARELIGKSDSGFKARETDPFIVITGKGLHSDGGVSKIRASIKALLNKSRYKFLEEEARFVVIGLKRL
ncbi:Ubiquitin-binding protein CUE2 [Wickerhamomyces ciferrii]|uniref:RNA polymerase II degradation factor 1 n=1 Tax=Wickerhamomyces ciferrii (strain ATCC 14091 / BCRC 22168 / CBS 111 / JCM 3599 / NBRC 0793 / NRRL Y-1031 F-60-10) TaxID=1206466 RepID=K0KPA2_WICCF|nr:Ubiquitin-binding protein CUE2 [Wickerhamomyces ciferrii]CCH44022.1 Ubiquitin-binding protein CUE2 [Wickerhamomyces ciferrii]